MGRKEKVLTATALGLLILLVASTAIASSLTLNTPLYTVRMEQESSKMNFLPTAVNGFTYTTEKGYTVNYNGLGHSGDAPLEITVGKTCDGTCLGEVTCQGYDTCNVTCWSTCPSTCGSTCPLTCDTCTHTCDTCYSTCIGNTCEETCFFPECTCSSCIKGQ